MASENWRPTSQGHFSLRVKGGGQTSQRGQLAEWGRGGTCLSLVGPPGWYDANTCMTISLQYLTRGVVIKSAILQYLATGGRTPKMMVDKMWLYYNGGANGLTKNGGGSAPSGEPQKMGGMLKPASIGPWIKMVEKMTSKNLDLKIGKRIGQRPPRSTFSNKSTPECSRAAHVWKSGNLPLAFNYTF